MGKYSETACVCELCGNEIHEYEFFDDILVCDDCYIQEAGIVNLEKKYEEDEHGQDTNVEIDR